MVEFLENNIIKNDHNINNKYKKKGFTLIEVVVVLAITVMIAGVIYTFYNSNNRTLTAAEAKSILQTEANQIQKELINIGTQATSVNIEGSADDVEKIKFTAHNYTDESKIETYVFDSSNANSELSKSGQLHDMYIYKDGSSTGQAKSKHVKSVKIEALDSSANTVSYTHLRAHET